MGKILYKEEQRFTQSWLWLLLIFTTLIATIPLVIGIYRQAVLGKPWGNHPGSTGLLVFVLCITSALMVTLLLLFYKMRLIVEIRQDGIWYRYPPLSGKWAVVKKEEIERFEVRIYKPVIEFGGWGIKGDSKNKAYNVSGNTGLQIYLKDGKKILFGTQKKQAINYAMEILMKSEREE